MIRDIDHGLLGAISIECMGDTRSVRNAVLLMNRIGKKSIAVRDGDVGSDEANDIFSFPGSMPPEKEVYEREAVKEYLNEEFHIDINNEVGVRNIQDHHDLTNELADSAHTSPDYFRTIAIKRYILELGRGHYEALVNAIAEHA